jgi:CheY-like chemotaxis protein
MDTESKRADEAMRESERRYSLLFDHCAGASVTAAANAHDALEARDPFDVILSDIAMPEMDGFAFLRRMRSRATATDIPAIALTAYARQEDVERALGSVSRSI